MSLIKKQKKAKAIRRSTSAPHQQTADMSSPLVPRSPSSGSSGDEAQQPPSQFFRSLKLGKGKSQTWSPEDPPRQRHHSPAAASGGFHATASSSSGEIKTSSPSRARRASKMFRKIGGGSRIVAHHHQQEDTSASPSAVTPPLWLPLVDFLCRAVEQHGKLSFLFYFHFYFYISYSKYCAVSFLFSLLFFFV
jgi:hypothetical protein